MKYNLSDILFTGFCIGMLGVIIFLTVVLVKVENEKQEALKENACTQISSVSTGKRVYCGKACWRDEMKVEYTCKSGIKIMYN